VFSRWTKVVLVSVSPPVGPSSVPVTVTLSQAMASDLTNAGSVEESPGSPGPLDGLTLPHTVLESRACCHVTRIGPSGHQRGISFGLKRVEVGGEFLKIVAEEGCLRREKHLGDARS
jgi:hypothetical protein